MGKNQAVFGLYPNRETMDEAFAELQAFGFRSTDISALSEENAGTKQFAHEKNAKTPEGFMAGAIVGAAIGGVLGWMASLGTVVIPGIELFQGVQPLLATLAGAGAGGVVAGLLGALIGRGIPEYEAKRYKGRLRKGGLLLSVHCDNSQWVKRARTILLQTGAEGIATALERDADYAVSDKPTSRRPEQFAASRPAARPVGAESTTAGRPVLHRFGRARPSPAPVAHMPVKEVMSTNVQVVDADSPISEAAEKMKTMGVGFLPVRSAEVVIGLITDRDIAIRAGAAGFDPGKITVRSVMTANCAYCQEDQDVAEAAKIMEDKQVRRLPVVDKEMRLVGVVSLSDVATKAGDAQLAGEVLRQVAGQRR